MVNSVIQEKVSTSVPVSIMQLPDSQFNLNEKNPFVTHAKLKIFYVGMTDDGRLFTEDFSNKLIKTLPQSPVVAYFDEESEDFKAHNQKQYAYGYVPDNAKIYFEEEDDRVWAFTDVVLFTGRKDNIGEVATKIIGMQHSLELDPDTVEYKINKDSNGKVKNIEFTEGKFIGLSVVGKKEKPAFNGSHFFTIEEESEMVSALLDFQESVMSYFDCDTTDSEGISLCVFRNLDDIDLKPTQTMANNAKRGLELRKEYGRGGTEVGVARARDLMNRKNLSPRTVQRMFSYFSRHEVDKQGKGWNSDEEGYPSAGLIAWLLWGGDAGFRWAESKRNQIERARESQTSLIDRKLSIHFEEKIDGGVAMKKINKSKIVEHAEIRDEEVAEMAWSCDGMEHQNCEQQEDGSWMCDGMEHSNCEKIEDMKYPKDEEDMKHEEGHDDEDMKHEEGHDDEKDKVGYEEDMKHEEGHDDEEDMKHEEGHDDEEDEEEMKSIKFMRTPYDEIQEGVVKQFREAMGDNMYIVQWSFFDDMVAFYNGEDGKYYRSDFVMNDETEVITFGEPVVVKPRYITEEEIDQLFPEEDQGGSAEDAGNASAEDSAEEEGVLLSRSAAKKLEEDMAELQAFRKEDKLKLAATFQELVDKEVYENILGQVDKLTKDELETKLSVEAMKRIKADKQIDKAQTINPVKFYTGQTNTNSNVNPVASLIDQWKDKK